MAPVYEAFPSGGQQTADLPAGTGRFLFRQYHVAELPGISGSGRGLAPVVYHAGRIVFYMLGGLLFGLMGRGIYLAGRQQGFSIVMGVMILLVVVVRRLPLLGRLWRALGRWGLIKRTSDGN